MNRIVDWFCVIMPVFVVLVTFALVASVYTEYTTGYPARCATERFWHGENEWVKTHYCGYWSNQPPVQH